MNKAYQYGAVAAGGFIAAFFALHRCLKTSCRQFLYVQEDRERRNQLAEAEIDKMIMDSFPASDPPSTY